MVAILSTRLRVVHRLSQGQGGCPAGTPRRRLTGTAQRAPTVGSEELPTLDDMSILERGAADPLVATAGPLGRRARLDEVVRLTAASVLWLSLLLVTYWWVADGGVRDLRGWAGRRQSAGPPAWWPRCSSSPRSC